MPATLGDVTKTVFMNDPEAHKLHLAFDVAAAQVVHIGDPVILNADGTIQLAGVAAVGHTIIGTSMHEGVAGDHVTVAMKAYCVVVAEAAADAQTAGPVKLGAWNATTVRRAYAATTDGGTLGVTVGHALNGADNAGEIHVALLA